MLEGARGLVLLLCLSAVACGQAAVEIVAPLPGASVSLLTVRQRRFVDLDFDARAKYFVDANKSLRSDMRSWGTTPQPVRLVWKGATGPCEVAVRKRGESELAFGQTVGTNCVEVWNLEIGADYEWSVRADGTAAEGWFVTEAVAPRFVKVDGVVNCRDLGGRVGLGGRRVRQGLVYRTAECNRSTTKRNPPPSKRLITDAGLATLVGKLGVRTDIDLRRPDEYEGVTNSPLGVTWFRHSGSCYSNVVVTAVGRQQFAKVFRVFLDGDRYPIAFHCRGGADRTGTVGMILNALLGVCEDDLWKDYQVTAFWGTVGDTRHFGLFQGLLRAFDRYPGATLCERVAAYVKELGFTEADIAAFRRRMLEPVARPDLVEKVASGELKSAKASWWGYDPVDSTRFLQAAIDSKVPELTVDLSAGAWVVRPLHGVSDQRIVFEKGVEVMARKDAFHGLNDCLLKYDAKTNVVLKGEGAALRMRRWDYHAAPYRKGEWRHALSLLSCADVTVEGLTFAESGGDGIYVSTFRKGGPCRNVIIRDCLCDKNYRQGVSVISADGLLIERTVMRDTAGTPPAAGIDFEPNRSCELLRDCVMRDCVCANNQGASVELYLGQLDASSEPVGVRLENCRLTGAGRAGFRLANTALRNGNFPTGSVTLERCVIEGSSGAGVAVSRKPIDSVRLMLKSCKLVDNCRKLPSESPDVELAANGIGATVTDGVRFEDVTVEQPVVRRWLTRTDTTWLEKGIEAIDGTVRVVNPSGARTIRLDEAWRRETFGGPSAANRVRWKPFDPKGCKVTDPQPGAWTKLVPYRPRHSAKYVFYVEKARRVTFEGRQIDFAKKPKATYAVTEYATGREVAAGELPGVQAGQMSFDVPAAGFYAFVPKMNARNAFAMTGSDVPTAIELPYDGQDFIGGGGRVGFVMPPQGPVAVLVCGADGREFASVAVAEPSGREVWRNDKVDGLTGWTSDGTSPNGLWSLAVGKPSSGCFEDHYLTLRGTMPLLFVSPGKHWTTL